MSSATFRVRRATLDDLPILRPLWDEMRLNTADLERRLTEFQVVEDATGRVSGGIGFQITERHARIHSEAFSDFSIVDAARPLIWERIKALCLNHGIARLWTREDAPFWKQNGFVRADQESLKRLPVEWSEGGTEWMTLSLKDEDSIVSLEKELALFMESEKQRTAHAFKQARTLKTIATFIALIFGIFVIATLFVVMRKNVGR
jgi:N-acetylglutamate synthase-like GNAT family acetyltransferase